MKYGGIEAMRDRLIERRHSVHRPKAFECGLAAKP